MATASVARLDDFAISSSSCPTTTVKQRRVSLALASSPRLVQAWSFRDDTGIVSRSASSSYIPLCPEKRNKIRKISTADDDDSVPTALFEKKPRKRWSPEETQMLVDGCNRYGVGNWKTILSDETLKFDSRSPVDLKDRFRTYFPDAYKQHYPNARTHLSSKVRSTLPDGTSIFEKKRSKHRRPFTEDEDRALKAGYEQHGTVWAVIVKDPVFQEQNRRSTDLRDRFRNVFPELYQAAGYKPRIVAKKGKPAMPGGSRIPGRAATDDHLSMCTTGPVRQRQGERASQGVLLRGGTKSVPPSTACSEDDDSSCGEGENEEEGAEDEGTSSPVIPLPKSSVFVTTSSHHMTKRPVKGASKGDPFAIVTAADDDAYAMEVLPLDPLTYSDFQPRGDVDAMEDARTWSSSGADTPTTTHAWSTAAGSPTSSHLSADQLVAPSTDYFGGCSSSAPTSSPASIHTSFSPPSISNHPLRRGNSMVSSSSTNMIGKSAWGAQDWLSPNPRLDHIPFSAFHHALSHGVLDRYDLRYDHLFDNPFVASHGFGHTSQSGSNHGFTHASSSHSASGHTFAHSFAGSGSGSGNNYFATGAGDGQDPRGFAAEMPDFSAAFSPGLADAFECGDVGFGGSAWGGAGDNSVNGNEYGGWNAGEMGFMHHSNYAGDLISGKRTAAFGNGTGSGGSFGGSVGGSVFGESGGVGGTFGGFVFGSSLGTHGTSGSPLTLAGVNELGLTSITLDDSHPKRAIDVDDKKVHAGQGNEVRNIIAEVDTNEEEWDRGREGNGKEEKERSGDPGNGNVQEESYFDLLDLVDHCLHESLPGTPIVQPVALRQGGSLF